tara:strand:+ start:3066 stop:3455 length:390 start_codon:yes stop_codon:yes gene_type:complete
MTVRSFGSLDEMIAAMEEDKRAADSQVQEWQKKLKVGDYFLRVECGIHIFCEVLDPSVPPDGSLDPEEVEEIRKEAEIYKEPHMTGFRFCRCFSSVCPEGEVGDVHISTAGAKLRQEEFLTARQNDWLL